MIDGNTQVYGVLGQPVRHSLSPLMQNAAFAVLGIDAVYLPMPVDDIADAVRGIRALGLAGASVTIPFKESVMPYLDYVDDIARKIGAVNTVRIEESGESRLLRGSNTDWIGAVRALTEVITLKDRHVVVLGSGGSARAVGFGLLDAGAKVTLCSRDARKGQELASRLRCLWVPLTMVDALRGDILVNTTSVGLNSDETLMRPFSLHQYDVVMDIVYSPLHTRLLCDAAMAGCKIIHGLEMLLFQGVAQFELWTGKKAPVTAMRQALLSVVGDQGKIKQ
ncbi:MAG: shikimate dehydrogenase [Desulfobulbaceae bacterium]|jgi:shikimate dehydrogenase|nr:shikimate dehydrogenase [Desulfobulbaceae bacterium]